MGLRLMPGEVVHVARRPSPWAYVPAYAAAVLLAGAAGVLYLAFHSDFWAAGATHWYYIVGWPFTAYVLLLAAVAGWAALVSLRTGRNVAIWCGASLALVFVALCWAFVNDYRTDAPLFLAVLCIPLLLFVEVDRVSRRISFTNIRIAASGGVLGRWNRSARLQDITDLDVRGRTAKALDLGTLVAVLSLEQGQESATLVAFPGIRPIRKARDLARLLIQDATATPLLRNEMQIEPRLPTALRALR